jgi:hypothetical protein
VPTAVHSEPDEHATELMDTWDSVMSALAGSGACVAVHDDPDPVKSSPCWLDDASL